jgi:hypothetical protein
MQDFGVNSVQPYGHATIMLVISISEYAAHSPVIVK